MRRKVRLGFCLLLAAAAGCHYVEINYIGKSYPPTEHVNMYFDQAEVPADEKVIGRAIVTAPEGTKGEKVEQGLLQEARAKGADAILVGPVKQYLSGTSTDWNWNYYGGPGWAWGNPYGWGYGDPEWGLVCPPVEYGVLAGPSDRQTEYHYGFKMKVIFLKKLTDAAAASDAP